MRWIAASAHGPAFVLVLIAVSGCVGDIGSRSAEPTRIAANPTLTGAPSSDDLAALFAHKFQLGSIQPFELALPDGVLIRGHVYLPDAPPPFAVVLEYSPYFNQWGSSTASYATTDDGFRTMTSRHRVFLEAGFAVALVNLRGTGTSQGCIQWGSPLDTVDVTRVIEALATAPWSSGSVGMTGLSYPGWTQYLAIAGGSPYLKAVIPTSGILDLQSLVGRHGAAFFYEPVLIPERTATTSFNTAFYPPNDPRWGEANRAECADRFAEDNRAFTELALVGDRTPYWEARDLRDELARTQVPIFFTNGMTTGEGHILQFEGIWESLSTPERRMLVGPWNHGFPVDPPVDFNLMSVAWFDHYLRGGPKIIGTGVVEYQDAQKGWHETTSWPPPGTDRTLYLTGTALTDDPSRIESSAQTFLSADWNPCPGICTEDYLTTRAGEPPRGDQCGPFQALYVSPPLVSGALLAGEYHVNLTVTSTLPDGNFAAFLYHTSGDGLCPDPEAVEIKRALTDLRHAKDGLAGADFPINTPSAVNVRSHPFAADVPAGHRLVLAVGGGSLELVPDNDKPILTITTAPNLMNKVTLRVVEGELSFDA